MSLTWVKTEKSLKLGTFENAELFISKYLNKFPTLNKEYKE